MIICLSALYLFYSLPKRRSLESEMGSSIWKYRICILCVLCIPYIVLASFTPQDSFFIDCGGSKVIELDDGGVFEPDSGNSRAGLSSDSHTVISEPQVTISDDSSLYSSARVFKGKAAYTISTEQIGRH